MVFFDVLFLIRAIPAILSGKTLKTTADKKHKQSKALKNLKSLEYYQTIRIVTWVFYLIASVTLFIANLLIGYHFTSLFSELWHQHLTLFIVNFISLLTDYILCILLIRMVFQVRKNERRLKAKLKQRML